MIIFDVTTSTLHENYKNMNYYIDMDLKKDYKVENTIVPASITFCKEHMWVSCICTGTSGEKDSEEDPVKESK